jgi:hypothetical protein
MEKTLTVTKEQIKVEGERVYIDSAELANAIQDTTMDVFAEEEAGLNIGCIVISAN